MGRWLKAKKGLKILSPLIAALAIELLVFNIKHWGSLLGLLDGNHPFQFMLGRFAICVIVSSFFFVFRPSSTLYRKSVLAKSSRVAICIVVLLHSAVFAAIPMHYANNARFEPGFTKYDGAVYDDAQQYAYYANSIIEGQLHLDLHVPEYLTEMDNPYNVGERLRLARETGEPSYWDYAFYQGKYYCYFGALPALTMFVPFKLLTGIDLKTYYAVSFSAVLLCIAIGFFLLSFIKVYFPKTSLGVFLLLYMGFAMGCGITTHVFYPLFYSLPPLWSLICLFIGFGLWLRAKVSPPLRKAPLFFGSLCIALTLGCRPQTFLFVFLAIPLFWDEIINRHFFSRKGMANTIAVLAPCIAVGIIAMIYNHARFGSPFDFGASYNLTGLDMTAKKSMSIETIWAAIIFYVFMPLIMKRSFPYFTVCDWKHVTVEPFHGGFFAFNPSTLAVFALPLAHDELRKKRLWGTCIISCLIAIVLMCLSSSIATISMRYFSDFCFGFLFPAMCVWLCFAERYNDSPIAKRMLISCLLATVAIGEFANFFSLLATERYGALAGANPELFALFQQWFSL